MEEPDITQKEKDYYFDTQQCLLMLGGQLYDGRRGLRVCDSSCQCTSIPKTLNRAEKLIKKVCLGQNCPIQDTCFKSASLVIQNGKFLPAVKVIP